MDFRQIKAVTFDAGGTLIEPWPSVGDIYAKVAAELGFSSASPGILNRQFAAAWKQKQNFDYSLDAWRKLVEESFADILAVRSELFAALYQRFAQPDAWRIYNDVEATLKELHRRGYRLAVISNWDERLVPLLEGLGLSRYLDAVILSVNVGATKPSPRIFQHATAKLHLPPQSVLHVGDSLEEDARGAGAAGMCALLLDRQHASEATGSIYSLSILLELLKTRSVPS